MNKKVQKIEPEEGYKGFLAIRCEKCGMLNAYCGRRKSDHYRCRCGAITPLHDLVRVYVYCECRRSAVYRTNVTDTGRKWSYRDLQIMQRARNKIKKERRTSMGIACDVVTCKNNIGEFCNKVDISV